MSYAITHNCTGCTACLRRCPTDAIAGSRGKLHVIDPSLCIDCGACGVVCPDAAIYDEAGRLCRLLKGNARPKAIVDEPACTGCEWCLWACPFDALILEPSPPGGGFASIVKVIEKRCTGCTLCELDCPYDAIHILRGDDPAFAARRARNEEWRAEVARSAA